jgi:hypothetical protein
MYVLSKLLIKIFLITISVIIAIAVTVVGISFIITENCDPIYMRYSYSPSCDLNAVHWLNLALPTLLMIGSALIIIRAYRWSWREEARFSADTPAERYEDWLDRQW